MALPDKEIEQRVITKAQIEEILKEQENKLVQLYTKEVLEQRLKKLHINKNSFDVLFGELIDVISVDINEWVAEFDGDKQAAANALRTAASKTITEQEFARFLNSVPASARPKLQRLHDTVHNNTVLVGEWTRKPMVTFLIGATEGVANLTAEKIKDVQDLVSDYLTETANKIAGPVITPQPEAVQVPHENPVAEVAPARFELPVATPVYYSAVDEEDEEYEDEANFESGDGLELLSDSDRELMQDIYRSNPDNYAAYNAVIYCMQLQVNSGQEVKFELCLMIALVTYDKPQNEHEEQEENSLLVQEIDAVHEAQLIQAVSLANGVCKAIASRYGFFHDPLQQEPFFRSACRNEEQQSQLSRTRDIAENFVPIPIPTNS